MTNRAIVMFPKFNNIKLIDEIREKYDPLSKYIAPHITLVFPFGSELSTDELIQHIKQSLAGIGKIQVQMSGVTGDSDGYIFLDVKEGNDRLIKMHDRLYEGILKEYHNRFIPFFPHLTVGRVRDEKAHREAVTSLFAFKEVFKVEIDEVAVVSLEDKEKAIIEYIHKL